MLHKNILIPCKRFSEGKTRLANLLSANQRYELCAFFLERTLKVARELAPGDRIWLVTADETASMMGKVAGVNLIHDDAGALNTAVCQGRDQIVRQIVSWREGLLILPIDLPLADEAAIMSVDCDSDVSVAADHDYRGTNLLLLKRDAVRDFDFQYGASSLARHRANAQRAGYSITILNNPALAFDVDEAEDYLHAERLGLLQHLGAPS